MCTIFHLLKAKIWTAYKWIGLSISSASGKDELMLLYNVTNFVSHGANADHNHIGLEVSPTDFKVI